MRFRSTPRGGSLLLVMLSVVWVAACVNIFVKGSVRALPNAPTRVTAPVKAHLTDGGLVIYRYGLTIRGGMVVGVGTRYGISRTFPLADPAGPLPLDSVIGFEVYDSHVDAVPTLLATAGATALTVAAPRILVAIFGSCPTFYSDSSGTAVLEAEGFSYSIAPLFQGRDVDRLRVTADSNGRVRLEVRNEALETHYLDHLRLIEVRHAADEFALPAQDRQPLVVRGMRPVEQARDRVGRDLTAVLRAADGNVFSTDARTLASVRLDDLDDYIDITTARPPGADSVAITLRLRNSLLATELLYGSMLGTGAAALNLLGDDYQRISKAVELGRWFGNRMGMRVAIRERGTYRVVAQIDDTGPIAFSDVGVVVPVSQGGDQRDSLHIRLSFAADDWRIDRIAIVETFRRPDLRDLPIVTVTGSNGMADTAALARLRAPDEQYVVTEPGDRFFVTFDAGQARASTRTFMLESQGYYTEWVRGAWVRAPIDTVPFVPSDTALLRAQKRWQTHQREMERKFYATRIPVR